MKSELDLINRHVFIGMMVQAYPEKISQAERERNHADATGCCESISNTIKSDNHGRCDFSATLHYVDTVNRVRQKYIVDIDGCITSRRQQSEQKTKSSIMGKFISIFAKINQDEIKDKDDQQRIINQAAARRDSETKRRESTEKRIEAKREMLKPLKLAKDVADYAALPGRSLALNQAIDNYFENEQNPDIKQVYFKLMESYDELLQL